MTTLAAYLDRTDVTANIGDTPIPGIAIYLDVAAADYPVLRAQYGEAIDWCNETLSKLDFVDDAGVSANPPDMAVLGVYAYVKATREIDARPAVGIKKTKTGAREEEYGDGGAVAYMTPASAAWPKLEKLCEDATLFSSGRG